MRLLSNPIRAYAWGSREAIARLQGRPVPAGEPEAELWMGAHPSAPSMVDGMSGPVPLNDLIAADPTVELGPAVVDRFGARLPYLVKLLAAREPLSIQVHPDEDQARRGFAAEETAGVPRDARRRRYVDPHHKPELLVAVDDFEALCGFRDPAVSARIIDSFGVAALVRVSRALRDPDPVQGLRQAVTVLLAWPESERLALVSAVADAAQRSRDREQAPDRTHADTYDLVVRLAGAYPGDPGVVLAVLLDLVRLRPGQAVFMPAGSPHAYLSGVGVEVMAASDNVLRGGLTPKFVDPGELLRILRFEPGGGAVLEPTALSSRVATWRVPAAEFSVVRAVVAAGQERLLLPGVGPRIVFCLTGKATVESGGPAVVLAGGEAVFVPAVEPVVSAVGDATLFQVAVPVVS